MAAPSESELLAVDTEAEILQDQLDELTDEQLEQLLYDALSVSFIHNVNTLITVAIYFIVWLRLSSINKRI